MTHRQTRQFCRLDDECQNILKTAMTDLGLSARAHNKVLRVARTIADLDGSESIRPMHLNEAINYRTLDQEFGDVANPKTGIHPFFAFNTFTRS